MSAKLIVYKRNTDDPKYLVPCPPDDKDALSFRITYPGQLYSYIEFDNLSTAANVQHALDLSFEAGEKQAMRGLRKFMGVNDGH